jgi:hypothetical protein
MDRIPSPASQSAGAEMSKDLIPGREYTPHQASVLLHDLKVRIGASRLSEMAREGAIPASFIAGMAVFRLWDLVLFRDLERERIRAGRAERRADRKIWRQHALADRQARYRQRMARL